MKRISLGIFLCLLFSTSLWAAPDFKAMLKELDELGSFKDSDFSCVYTIVAEKPDTEPEVTQARMFRRDAKEQFVLLILKPDVQKGQGYLQVDDNVWFYDPQSRKFSHSSLKENIQNSDAKNSDVAQSSLSEDYEIEKVDEGYIESFPVYIMTLKAKNNEVSFPKLKLWIRKDATIVLKQENYSLSDRLMRTALFPNYVKVGEKLVPSKMIFTDNLKPGEKTQLTMKDPSVKKLPDSVFTKAFLEKVNN
jgi:outer membrane lipoprotein-sorting protein